MFEFQLTGYMLMVYRNITLPETNSSPMKNPIFPGKYHQNCGFSMAMLVSGSVVQGITSWKVAGCISNATVDGFRHLAHQVRLVVKSHDLQFGFSTSKRWFSRWISEASTIGRSCHISICGSIKRWFRGPYLEDRPT